MAKVLLFEDEGPHGVFISKLLYDLGHEVIWVKNKEEAEDALENNDFDLFVLDIKKVLDRGIDIDYGFKIAQSIHNHPKFKNTPIVFVTIRDDRRAKETAKKLGAAAYFVKPIMPSDFRKEIQKILKNEYNF